MRLLPIEKIFMPLFIQNKAVRKKHLTVCRSLLTEVSYHREKETAIYNFGITVYENCVLEEDVLHIFS